MENKKEDDCIFCFSLLFSNIKIEYKGIPIITSKCYLNHQKQIELPYFLDYNNKSFDNSKLKVECPLCKEYLDKDSFFICVENNKLICPKCIALNIIISSSSNKKKKGKVKKSTKIKNEPHYSTLISILKESIQEKTEISFVDEKIIEKEKNDINEKYKQYKDIIINEIYIKKLVQIYNFLNYLNEIKKKIHIVYKENKGYLSKRFHENIQNIIPFDGLYEIFLNNFSFNENKQIFVEYKELKNIIQSLLNYYKSKNNKNILINKLLLVN
mgnify:CR=1 FL=1